MNMGICYSIYLQREQAIRKARRQEQPQPLAVEDDEELSDAELYRLAPAVPETESELSRFLQQERHPRGTDIYQYWRAKQYDYPIVAKIAKDHLAIPAISALSECVFSISGDVITKKRNRLTGDTVRFIVRLNSWGIITEEDSEDDTIDA